MPAYDTISMLSFSDNEDEDDGWPKTLTVYPTCIKFWLCQGKWDAEKSAPILTSLKAKTVFLVPYFIPSWAQRTVRASECHCGARL